MKVNLNKPEALILTAVVLAILTHLAWVVNQSYSGPLTSRHNNSSVAQAIQFGSLADSQSSSEAFSLLFGVTPEKAKEAAVEVPLNLTLADMQPTLVAIDEINGKLTARLSLSRSATEQHAAPQKSTGLRLVSANVGSIVHGFTLTELTNNNAVFVHNASADEPALPQLSLSLFKPQVTQ